MNLNLEALGVTEASLEKAILSQLNLTREGAVKALAQKFGVDISPAATVVVNGAEVPTTEGTAKAAILSDSDLRTLREAAAISTRLFS